MDGTFAPMFDMADLVAREGACALPGVHIRYDNFMNTMWRAVARGFVETKYAEFVAHGLRWGFEAGLDRSLLQGIGHRLFHNYPPAETEFKDAVVRATRKRVEAGKTLDLGVWSARVRSTMRAVFDDAILFPMSAVGKPLEPGEGRPLSDHTKTGLNAATVMGILKHTVHSYEQVAYWLRLGHVMHVSDVDAAFPMLPFAPWVWGFMFHRFFSEATSLSSARHLYVHLNGDFGTRGFPGVFHIFFEKVLCMMARSEMVLTLPLAVHVDDLGLIGALGATVAREMGRFQAWAEGNFGVRFKTIKDKKAAHVQYMIGFWWDSFERTRTLDESKLCSYMALMLEFSTRPTLSLREMQQAAGRMQRAVMTLPPGAACLIASLFALMAGLKLSWHRRRTNRKVRQDFRFMHDVLGLNMGSGFFSFDRFERGPETRSDACKGKYCGGGFVSEDGVYDWHVYCKRATRQPIDFLEGDTVVHAVERRGSSWYRKWVPFGVDNDSFQKSARKGWSRAERLTLLLKRLFVLQLRFQCILKFFWLGTKENFLADDLSRGRIEQFLRLVYVSGFWKQGVEAQPLSGGGRTRRLDESPPIDRSVLAAHARPRRDMLQYQRQVAAVVMIQAAVRGLLSRAAIVREGQKGADRPVEQASDRSGLRRSRAVRGGGRGGLRLVTLLSIFGCVLSVGSEPHVRSVGWPSAGGPPTDFYTGLSEAQCRRVDEILGDRLAASSMRTVNAALAIWRGVAEENGWPVVIETSDRLRGAKLSAFVIKMFDDTSLVYSTIENYVWGLAQWMILQRQADPRHDFPQFSMLMAAIKVGSWVQHEPRRALPLAVVTKIAEECDLDDFASVQFVFFMLVLLFTFSRSECPCPKNFTGAEAWDDERHWMVRDFKLQATQVGETVKYVLAVRFKAVKQDPRVERPTARVAGEEKGEAQKGGSDWAYVGDVPGSVLSILTWYERFMAFFPDRRAPTEPMFLARDRVRPYTYRAAMSDLKEQLQRFSPDDTDYGLHGLRVLGYNLSIVRNGEELTVAHGLWLSSAHTRYHRFSLTSVYNIPARMLDQEPVFFEEEQTEERPVVRGLGSRTSTPRAPGANLEEPPTTADAERHAVPGSLSPPPGWRVVRGSNAPDSFEPPQGLVSAGATAQARLEGAWRVHNELSRLQLGDAEGEGVVLTTRTRRLSARPRGSPSQ